MSGLVIVGLTVLVIFIIRWIFLAIFQAHSSLCDWYYRDKGSLIMKILGVPVWCVLTLLVFVLTTVAVLCGIALAKKTYKWFNH